MSEASDARTSAASSGRRWKTVPVTVVLPDCSAYFMELREDCKGFDCLAKVSWSHTYIQGKFTYYMYSSLFLVIISNLTTYTYTYTYYTCKRMCS